MPGTVKSGLLSDADKSYKCDSQEKVCWILNLPLDKGHFITECTDKSITDISMDAGFESQRTFNRVFRERYKMTPREYRNLYREKFVLQNEII